MNKYKVTFIGAHSTGKTTLLNKIIEKNNEMKIAKIDEVARKVIDKGYPLNKETMDVSYMYYISKQLEYERKLNNCEFDLLISDRTIIDLLAYTIVNKTYPQSTMTNEFLEMLHNLFLLHNNYYDLYVYFPIEFPMVLDTTRPNDEDYRKKIDNTMLKLLNDYDLNYLSVNGSCEERYEMFSDYISEKVRN